ncbi:hypothetical protein TSUD_02370 [Trifolium subterraneum]|nr:hypothetical protein TSUD_02370 [Trifolium subterraneum]
MMKKHRKSSSPRWSESEIEIAEIIRDLYCISLLSSIPFSWGCKRKRSAIQNTPSPIIHHHHRAVKLKPTAVVLPPPPSTAVKTEAPSPETPLSFPATTESDDKPKHSSKKKTSLKREKESSLQIIQDLTKTKSSLNQEIEKVQQHYDRLMSINLKLKVRKQQLLCNSNERKSELKTPNLEIDQKLKVQLKDQSNGSVNISKSTAENEEHSKDKQYQQQQIQMFPSNETVSLAVVSSSSVALGRTMNNGPIALPDLNLPTEELVNVASFQPLDETAATDRAMVAAQARHRRIEIFRQKKPFGNNSKQYHQC